MKSLKFDHNLSQLILDGKKTTTWRLYDDKDLSVNDEVKLIDKVDPTNPATWKPIGTAHINEVIQKRLGDIGPQDYVGHELFATQKKMLDAYRKYYGDQVDLNTTVKIIRFTFNNNTDNHSFAASTSKPSITEVKLFADGGSRGNPGPSASGFAILDMNDKIVVKKSLYLGVTTNNQAEYQALKLGMQEALTMGACKVLVYMDSLLVVNQMLGIFRVKNRDLWPIYASIKELLPRFEQVTFTHVPRALNKIADDAVNEALDEALKKDKQ